MAIPSRLIPEGHGIGSVVVSIVFILGATYNCAYRWRLGEGRKVKQQRLVAQHTKSLIRRHLLEQGLHLCVCLVRDEHTSISCGISLCTHSYFEIVGVTSQVEKLNKFRTETRTTVIRGALLVSICPMILSVSAKGCWLCVRERQGRPDDRKL
jgi:hypothetical protein